MMDAYANFAELEQNERAGEDYTILSRERVSKVAIMAPHGGGIEPGTVDIADVVAGSDYTFYAFKGIKKTGNKILHITSNRYDEPIGLMISKNALIVISIHGCREKKEIVFIGGKNQKLKQKIMDAFKTLGFRAVISEVPGLRGISPENICNRCKSGQGVQLEISRGLREKMFDDLYRRSWRKKTEVFYKFVNAIKEAILLYQ
ncbi:MAG: poly-gamma-glutamate hydrolase family protein [Desulfosarcina sp.]|nr:poly-gamma-glutamate hydrolase family protein [Desulfobacterales bacterium]